MRPATPSIGSDIECEEASVQIRDLMTLDVVTVGPETSAKYAAEVMAERGFAALPVVDDRGGVIGIVAEADVLRDRLPQDPRLHLLREPVAEEPPALVVRGVMTSPARTVPATADVADVARLFLHAALRSVPVVDGDGLVGIVSRRDLLRVLVRQDAEVAADVLRLVEAYTQQLGCWAVAVSAGVATVWRRRETGDAGTADRLSDDQAVQSLARTVPGVVTVRLLPDAVTEPDAPAPQATESPV
jgi:CBS domain-containing protein